MKRKLACTPATARWYLLYPPAGQKTDPDSLAQLSKWVIDGSFGTAADCEAAHLADLSAMLGLVEKARKDFFQTQAGQCVAADDPRLPK